MTGNGQCAKAAADDALRRRSRAGLASGAVAVFTLTLVALIGTDSMYGTTYDEPIYVSKSAQVRQWLQLLAAEPGKAISDAGIVPYWHAKDRHPGFHKLVSAVAAWTLGRALPPGVAWRTGTNVLCAACFAVLFAFAAGLWGRAAGLYAVGALLLMPRVFGHCHLAALDASIMAVSLVAVVAAWRACVVSTECESARRAWLAAAWAGVLWGLAMGTKLNGFVVPLIVFPWAAVFARRRVLKLGVCYGVLGPLAFFVTWPWLWHHTWARLMEYLHFHLTHYPVGVTYFGEVYLTAPWHYALVMSAITVPLATGLLAVAGAVPLARARTAAQEGGLSRARAGALALAAWALLVNLAPSCLPFAPKYGGVRLFLPVFPYLALLAAVGLVSVRDRACRSLRGRVRVAALRPKLSALLGFAALVGPAAATARFTPYHLSYYNCLIGGLPGAVRAGMEPTYWGDTYRAASLWLAAHAPPGAVVWIEPMGFESTIRYFELGPMRPDVQLSSGAGGFHNADFAVTQNKSTEFTDLTRRLVSSSRPAFTDGIDGVPLVYVFRLR